MRIQRASFCLFGRALSLKDGTGYDTGGAVLLRFHCGVAGLDRPLAPWNAAADDPFFLSGALHARSDASWLEQEAMAFGADFFGPRLWDSLRTRIPDQTSLGRFAEDRRRIDPA